MTGSSSVSWDEALRGFVRTQKASKAEKTARFYEMYMRGVVRWSKAQQITLQRFGKMDLDEYLVWRKEQGMGLTTLHHDALCTKVFFKWCVRYDVMERNPLADYVVKNAPEPAMYMPTTEDMSRLLEAVQNFWDPVEHPGAKNWHESKRTFHLKREYAILVLLIDSACRIGEVLHLTQDNVQGKQVTVTNTKSKKTRYIPLSKETLAALAEWKARRTILLADVPRDEREEWLFLSENGGRMDEHVFLQSLKSVVTYAGLNKKITLHSVRRYSLNKLAKSANLMAAQEIAGHSDPKTTRIYAKADADFVRAEHSKADVLGGILQSKRAAKRPRLA
jgi:site-specific recombinase XerD